MLDTLFTIDPWTYATFIGASVVLYLTPGADMMFILASSLAGGPRAGLAAAVGVACGVLVHVAMAAVGLAALVTANPALLDVIRYAGAAYLAWLAWASWRDPGHLAQSRGRKSIARAFRRGFLTNILNPKVALFILAFLPQFIDPAAGPVWQQIVILGLILALGGVITDGAYGVAAGYMAERVRRSTRVMSRISAVIFGGLAARLAIS